MEQLRLALVAPSGSGKSTAAALMKAAFERHGKRVQIHKLAQPLYRLQECVYLECGLAVEPGRQDQTLLEALATHMRRIDPLSLVRHLEGRLKGSSADVVLNDDLRDDVTDWPWMRAAGFHVIRVEASPAVREQRLRSRGDLSVVHASALDAQLDKIEADTALPNQGRMEQLEAAVDALVVHLLRHSRASVRQ